MKMLGTTTAPARAGRRVTTTTTPNLTKFKVRFLAAYKQFTTATVAIRTVAADAIKAGAKRADFVGWLKEAGLTKGSAETTASRIMSMLDLKSNRGAKQGKSDEQKEIEKQAKGLVKYVVKNYGKDRAVRLLRAALMLAKG